MRNPGISILIAILPLMAAIHDFTPAVAPQILTFDELGSPLR